MSAERVPLDGTWRFWTGPDSWVPITVPFSHEPRGGLTSYQRIFTLPEGIDSESVLLRFEGLVGQATVYLNGVLLGEHGSYTPFWFDVSDAIHRTGENDLIVTLDDRLGTMTIPYEEIPWVNYSGINRSVWLDCTDTLTLLSSEPQYTLSADFGHAAGEIRVTGAGVPGKGVYLVGALLDGAPGAWTTAAAMDPLGPLAIGADGTLSAALSFALDEPKLWSPDNPRLYGLYVVAIVDGTVAAERLVQTGFRDIRVQGNKILLNGEPILLRGMSRHDLYPSTGFVGTEAQMFDDMTRIKAAGVNYVRLIHYPHHPRILELADQLGLLVSEEMPAWAFWDGEVRERLFQLLEESIRRDMHHPSLFLWISATARSLPTEYAAQAQQRIRSLDRNRLGSYVIDNDQYDPATIAEDVAFCRAAGLNLYMKITWWFYYLEYLQDAWTNFPKDMPIVIAELGREGNDREPIVTDGDQSFWWGEDQQASAVAEMLEAWRPHLPQYNDVEHISGLCIFNWQDNAWPEIARYLPNHVPFLHWGMVYENRTAKRVLSTVTQFYTGLPTEYVGLPTPQAAVVERLFHQPANLGPVVNAAQRESGPSISADGRTLYFASDGPDYVGLPKIFRSERQADGAWSTPQLVEMPLETEDFAFRGSPCISYDGQTLFFTRALVSGIYVARTRIWQSTRSGSGWRPPEDLGDIVNHPDASRATAHPSISADGQTLYFSSDRPGGYGGTDLWLTRRVNGSWTEPVSLGPVVNSTANDGEPSISPDGATLYFSSDRPGGLGSTDLWVTHLVNGAWSEPRNLGPEVNSSGADREPEVAKNGRTLFFTGIRAGGSGLSDLWQAVTVFRPGDFDRDGQVTADDLEHLIACRTGPTLPQDRPDCLDARLDFDADVDADDFGILQRELSRSGAVGG